MSAGFQCDCPLPPVDGLKASDNGHYRRPYAPDRKDCPQYAADQQRGGMCDFCRDAHTLLRATRPADDAEAVTDANGDELEHGQPDYPGQDEGARP
jgi:hypothetical protein